MRSGAAERMLRSDSRRRIAGGVRGPHDEHGLRMTRYRIDDAAHVGLRRVLRGFVPAISIVGVYHSHPAGDAVPSPSDIAEAMYPDWVRHCRFAKRPRARAGLPPPRGSRSGAPLVEP
jgi:proteasome lid subunit RPN8/RPN11